MKARGRVVKVAVTDESIEVEFCLGRGTKTKEGVCCGKAGSHICTGLASCWSTETACPNLRVFWRGEKKCLKREEGQ